MDQVTNGDPRIGALKEKNSSCPILEERYQVFRRVVGDDSLQMDGILLAGLGRRKGPHFSHLCKDPRVALLARLRLASGRKRERY
ncbi:MAG: hypothetical protein ABSF64_12025, partial [Bryobacteraceae bacterium]